MDIIKRGARYLYDAKLVNFLTDVSSEITRNNPPSTTTSEAGPATEKRSNSSPSQDQTGEPPTKRGCSGGLPSQKSDKMRNNPPSTTTSEAGPATVKRRNLNLPQDQTGEPPTKRWRPPQNNSVVDAAQALMGLRGSGG